MGEWWGWQWRPSGSRRRRRRLAVALICCSPILLPLICLSFPLLCIAAICCGLRPPKPLARGSVRFLHRCEEGSAGDQIEGRLLHRYLEDQLGLVWGCDDSDDDQDRQSDAC